MRLIYHTILLSGIRKIFFAMSIMKNNAIPEVMIWTIKFKYYFHQIISFGHVLYFTVN